MGTWLTENIATIIIGVLLMAASAAILVHMIRNRKNRKGGCGGGCAGCPGAKYCHMAAGDQEIEK